VAIASAAVATSAMSWALVQQQHARKPAVDHVVLHDEQLHE
jgi:hypothetical protein